MTTVWSDWLERSKVVQDIDPYAAYIYAYIALILFCRKIYNIPIGDEDIPIDLLIEDYSEVYFVLTTFSKYKSSVRSISEYFKFKPNLHYYYHRQNREQPFRSGSFKTHLYFLRNVRNNLVHGHKDFEARSEEIVNLANKLIVNLFDEILTQLNEHEFV